MNKSEIVLIEAIKPHRNAAEVSQPLRLPFRKIQRTPLMTSRASFHVLPRLSSRRGGDEIRGSIIAIAHQLIRLVLPLLSILAGRDIYEISSS
jgi:hypothetical protein